MLSRRRCCVNAAILIVLTFLSALILVWSSVVNNYGEQEQPTSHHQPQPKSLNVGVSGGGDPIDADLRLLNRSLPIKVQISGELLKRFPKIMIVGFGKTGTKALYEALKLHPQVSGPYKEKRFFSKHYSLGLESYLRSLPNPPEGGFNSEKSPDYIIEPASPSRIISSASIVGINMHSLKFIVVLRDPINRAVSEYLEWNIQRKSLNRQRLPPFQEMVIDKTGNVDASQPFLNASCYAYHIHNWLKHFAKEQMCYVDGDMFVFDPLKELHLLEECLQLEHYFSEKNFTFDKERGFYCFQDPKSVSNSLCMNKSKGRKHPYIPEHVVEMLRTYFQPWNNLLPNLIGRTITWMD